MRHILLENAYVSWRAAIAFHDLIERGFSSFQNQKGFVSSLHNAVELFMKQILLDKNDHKIAEVRNIKDKDSAQLALNYYNATDLNRYFLSLSPGDLDMFKSKEFNGLINSFTKIVGATTNTKEFKDALKTLQRLRNNESHFFVDINGYLSENDYVALHNFMADFYNVLLSRSMFPWAENGFYSTPYLLTDVKHSMDFTRGKLSQFSYVDALKQNSLVKELKEIIKEDHETEYACYGDNNYSIAMTIVYYHKELSERIDDIFVALQLLRKYKLLEIITTCENVELEDGSVNTIREDSFNLLF